MDTKEIINKLKQEKQNTNNLFSVLGIENKEIFHSRFLAFLLAPDGCVISGKDDKVSLGISHKYNTQFLDSFIKICNLKIGNRSLDKAKVYIEYPFEYDEIQSRIDILIQIGNYWIGIENKIYADDGDLQLERYSKLPESLKEKVSPKEYKLVYLTLNAREPSKKSKGNLEDNEYIRISYLNDISDILLNCRRIHDDFIEDFVFQYKNALAELLKDYNLSQEINDNWELITSLLKNKNTKEKMEVLLKDYILPKIVFDLCNNQDDFFPENNTFYIWIKTSGKKEYDLFFELQTDLQVIYYPIMIDRTNSQNVKWYWGGKSKANKANQWNSWGTKKNRKCWERDTNIPVDEFLTTFKNDFKHSSSFIDMKKFIMKNI